MAETEQGVRLASAMEDAAQSIHEYHEGDWEPGPQELRTEAQAIIDWANYKMGEGAGQQRVRRNVDPWGAPVDKRGM